MEAPKHRDRRTSQGSPSQLGLQRNPTAKGKANARAEIRELLKGEGKNQALGVTQELFGRCAAIFFAFTSTVSAKK